MSCLTFKAERVIQTEMGNVDMVESGSKPNLIGFISGVQSQVSRMFAKAKSSSSDSTTSKSVSDIEPTQLSIKELVDEELKMKAQELKGLKELSDIEKSMWDEKFDDRREQTKD